MFYLHGEKAGHGIFVRTHSMWAVWRCFTDLSYVSETNYEKDQLVFVAEYGVLYITQTQDILWKQLFTLYQTSPCICMSAAQVL